MKKKLIYLMILATGLVLATNLGLAQNTLQMKPAKVQQKVQYTCPMHSEVVQDQPGKCPKCGMELVIKKDTHKEMIHTKSDSMGMKHGHMMPDSTDHMHHYIMKDSTSMKHDHKMK